jgi:hypothetical protein
MSKLKKLRIMVREEVRKSLNEGIDLHFTVVMPSVLFIFITIWVE